MDLLHGDEKYNYYFFVNNTYQIFIIEFIYSGISFRVRGNGDDQKLKQKIFFFYNSNYRNKFFSQEWSVKDVEEKVFFCHSKHNNPRNRGLINKAVERDKNENLIEFRKSFDFVM